MRRQDKAISEFSEQVRILQQCSVLHLAITDENRPYIVPVNYGVDVASDEVTLYFHGANEGTKVELMKKHPDISFVADYEYEIKKAEMACGWTSRYESVIGYGMVTLVTEADEKQHGLDCIMAKYGFQGKPEYAEAALARIHVYKINVAAMTGKSNGGKS